MLVVDHHFLLSHRYFTFLSSALSSHTFSAFVLSLMAASSFTPPPPSSGGPTLYILPLKEGRYDAKVYRKSFP